MSSVSTGSVGSSGTPTSSTGASIQGSNNSWSWSEPGPARNLSVDYRHFVGSGEYGDGSSSSDSGSWSTGNVGLNADSTYTYKAKAIFTWQFYDGYDWVNRSTTKTGNQKSKKTNAMNPSASAPTYSNVTTNSATIGCNYFPNVSQSTCVGQMQIKRAVDPTWINVGSSGGLGGYAQRSVSVSATGLEPATNYLIRLHITRTTNNGTVFDSSIVSFATLAGEPEVTTDAATGVTPTQAVLNGSLLIKAGTGVNCYFVWDTANPPVANQTPNIPMAADGSFQQQITGLSANTTYYFKAVVSFASA